MPEGYRVEIERVYGYTLPYWYKVYKLDGDSERSLDKDFTATKLGASLKAKRTIKKHALKQREDIVIAKEYYNKFGKRVNK